jgi:hypothetical protein
MTDANGRFERNVQCPSCEYYSSVVTDEQTFQIYLDRLAKSSTSQTGTKQVESQVETTLQTTSLSISQPTFPSSKKKASKRQKPSVQKEAKETLSLKNTTVSDLKE